MLTQACSKKRSVDRCLTRHPQGLWCGFWLPIAAVTTYCKLRGFNNTDSFCSSGGHTSGGAQSLWADVRVGTGLGSSWRLQARVISLPLAAAGAFSTFLGLWHLFHLEARNKGRVPLTRPSLRSPFCLPLPFLRTLAITLSLTGESRTVPLF